MIQKHALILFSFFAFVLNGFGQINENIQSWTNRPGYGAYTQNIPAGTVNLSQCIVANASAATGTGTAGRVQLQGANGIIQLPLLPSVGTVEFRIAAGGANRNVTLQYFDGLVWSNLTTWSGIGTVGATYTYTYNTPNPTQLRLALPSAALYVHDIIISLNSSTDEVEFCNLQFPRDATINLGDAFSVFGQVYEGGITPGAGQGAGITAEIGYSTTNTNPDTWTNWIPATYNTTCADCNGGQNDEYFADLGAAITTAGTYYYATRYSLNSGPYTYGGILDDGSAGDFWDGVTYVSGALTVIGEPDILITGYQNDFITLLTNNINNGDETPLGFEGNYFAATDINATTTKKYRITNIGSESLNVSSIAVDAINVTSTNGATPPGAIVYTDTTIQSDHFYLSDALGVAVTSTAMNIPAGDFIDFYVTFSPQAMGWQFAKIKLNNNVVGKNPYTYLITGNGLTPDINITGNGNSVINGSTEIDVTATNNTFIGNANAMASESVSQSFIITNTGNDDLALGAISITGVDASMFMATVDLTTIPTSGFATLTVTFTPTSQGVKNATISIVNNDALGGENPYTFAVQGNAQEFIACAAAEEIIYQTGFEEVEFTAQTDYQSTVFDGPVGQQWLTYYGTPSTTAPLISGTKSLQMRLYTNGNIGYTQTEFDLQNVTKVEFRAKSPSSELDIQVSFSTDGGTTFNNNPQIYDVSAIGDYNNPPVFTYVVSPTGAFDNVRIRFTVSGIIPTTGRKDVSIDDIIIYAGSNNEKIWDGDEWVDSDGNTTTAPTSSQKAIFAGGYNSGIDGDVEACTCEIQNDVQVIISDGTYFEIQDYITVDGTLIVEPEGSFVQVNDLAIVDGAVLTDKTKIIVRKETAPMNNWYEYTYWSSPVAGETIQDGLTDATPNRRFWFNAQNFLDETAETGNNNGTVPGQDDVDDDANDWTLAAGTDMMLPGVGYASTHRSNLYAQFPCNNGSNCRFVYTFEGPFNNGIYNVPIYRNDLETQDINWSFIGNPYPSAISTVLFFQRNSLAQNANGALDGAIYLWSQNTTPSGTNNGNENLNFAQADYAIISGSGNTAGGDMVIPLNYIPSGQGFFVSMSNTAIASDIGNDIFESTVEFNNSMRVTDNNTQFFRIAEELQPNKLWVNLTSNNGVFNQILVSYIDGATDAFDGMYYDATRNLSTGASSILYSLIPNSDKKFAIQGKEPNSLTLDEVIPLGFYTSINQATIYKLSIAQFEGDFFANQTVFIKDNLLNLYHNLSAADYPFTSETGEFNDRFEIVFQTETLGVGEINLQPNGVSIIELPNGHVKFSVDHNLTIESVEIYDMLGRTLYNLAGSDTTEIYDLNNLSQAAYIAKVTLSNGQTVTKRAVKRQ